jgi:hypothetical protein
MAQNAPAAVPNWATLAEYVPGAVNVLVLGASESVPETTPTTMDPAVVGVMLGTGKFVCEFAAANALVTTATSRGVVLSTPRNTMTVATLPFEPVMAFRATVVSGVEPMNL